MRASRRVGAVLSAGDGVLLTGASSGIGAAAASELARAGFRTFGGVRDTGAAAELERVGVVPVMLDVTDPSSVAGAREVINNALGDAGLAGLVNNAGISAFGPLEHLPLEEVRRVVEVNLLGVVAVTQAFLPLLRAARGRIVNVSSVSGLIAAPFIAPYAASKFGLEGLSDSLRRELAGCGVSVIVIEPGTVRTPIWEKARAAGMERFRSTAYAEALERFGQAALSGLGRATPPEAIARAISGALTAKRPRARILISRRPLRTRLLASLPASWLDSLIARRLRP